MLLAGLAGLWVATELFAWWAGFPLQLGPSWAILGGFGIYPPWKILAWMAAIGNGYGWGHPAVASGWRALAYGAVLGFLPIAILGGIVKRRLGDPQGTVHGSGRWATGKEIARAGLYGEEGIALGRIGKKYLIDNSPTHVLMFAPTRSGKGVGVVIPTLCTWGGSVIVNDIKGENWDITSRYRAEKLGQRCIKFNPTDKASSRYNPLAEIGFEAGTEPVIDIADVQKIAEILIDPEGRGEMDYWMSAGCTLLTGLIQYVFVEAWKNGKVATLKDLLAVATSAGGAKTNHERLLYMREIAEGWEPSLAGPVVSCLNEMFSKAEKELSGVVSTATNALSLYRDPVVQGVVGQSDFSLDDIADGDVPVSLYLVVPPSDLSRTKPLIRLVLNQLGKRLAQKMDKKHPVLMLLDEFPTLGRLDFFETALAYLAGYKVRCLLITQSLAQLDNVYGRNNSIMANCSTRICYAPNEEKTARTIAHLLGEATVRLEQGKNRESRGAETLSYSDRYVKRFLMTPGEIMQMDEGTEIVFTSSAPPIRAEKIRYYAEERFKDVWHS